MTDGVLVELDDIAFGSESDYSSRDRKTNYKDDNDKILTNEEMHANLADVNNRESGEVDNSLDSLSRKCKNCEAFYSDPNSTCFYHPGVYKQRKVVFGVSSAGGEWTCCGSLNGDARTGCVSAYHAEDQTLTKLLDSFIIHRDEEPVMNFPFIELEEKKVEIKESEKPEYLIEVNGLLYLKYNVKESDSLVGICLKYKLKKEQVKRSNKIYSDDQIKALPYLLLPFKPETMGDEKLFVVQKSPDVLIDEFRSKTKTSKDEAKVYLELNNYDLDVALKSWEEDMTHELRT